MFSLMKNINNTWPFINDDLIRTIQTSDEWFNSNFTSKVNNPTFSLTKVGGDSFLADKDKLQIKYNVPGIDPNNIKVELDKDILLIKLNDKKNVSYNLTNYKDYDLENLQVEYKLGQLIITAPIIEIRKSKSFQIKVIG